MPLPTIKLDDRDFAQLVAEAKVRISQACPQWSDLSAGDPGMMLVELFAHLTDTMMYRLNRLPQKAFVEFLNLLGVNLQPPASASTRLLFTLDATARHEVEIPQYTRVAGARGSGGGQAPVFVTAVDARIPAGSTSCLVEAYHADIIEAELAGRGTGSAGLSVRAAYPPIVAGGLCLVGVEAEPGESVDRAPSIVYNGKTYRIWKETANFANVKDSRQVYVIDRMSGLVTFAPALQQLNPSGGMTDVAAALADVVKEGREIRVWYARGGGTSGNAAPHSLTVLKDPIPGVHCAVTNPEPATGGAAAESYENALIRGPLQFRSLERAVTAGDFELIAKQVSGAICRARAFTKASLWKHAARGTVEVLVVPSIPESIRNNDRFTLEEIKGQENDATLERILAEIHKRVPLGIFCSIGWVRYKRVTVRARVVVNSGEKTQFVKDRILDRLYQTINPVPTDRNRTGWEFDAPLRVSKIFDIVLAEPGVRYVDTVRLSVDEAPSAGVNCIRADAFQERMWYAACGGKLFRSWADGDDWQSIASWEQEEIRRIAIDNKTPGRLAVSANVAGASPKTSRIYISDDCGLTFRKIRQTAFEVEDIVWIQREEGPRLLLAADTGLFELAPRPDSDPQPVVVNTATDANGFYSIAAVTDARGIQYVAVAAQKTGGIFLSTRAGRTNSFSPIGLSGKDVRLIKTQQYDGRTFLWAGTTVGIPPGEGCFRLELPGTTPDPTKWVAFGKQWSGGTCRTLAFIKEQVFAGTHESGVLSLDSGNPAAEWKRLPIECGLPLRDLQRILEPVYALDLQERNGAPFMIVGGPKGAYVSGNGAAFARCSNTEFTERVILPPGWLFCSGEHDIKVVSEDEAD